MNHIGWNRPTSKIISPPNSDKIVMWRFLRHRRLILRLYYFQGTHILGASRGGPCDSVASCYYPQQWWRSVMNLGWSRSWPPLSLFQSSFLPFPPVDSPGGLDRARSSAAKHFDAIYTVKQPYQIHIDV